MKISTQLRLALIRLEIWIEEESNFRFLAITSLIGLGYAFSIGATIIHFLK